MSAIHVIRGRYDDGSAVSLCGLRGRYVDGQTYRSGRVEFIAVLASDPFQGGTCRQCRLAAAAHKHAPGPGKEPKNKKRRLIAA